MLIQDLYSIIYSYIGDKTIINFNKIHYKRPLTNLKYYYKQVDNLSCDSLYIPIVNIETKISPKVKRLTCSYITEEAQHNLSSSIKHLTFDSFFSMYPTFIPTGITHLTFGNGFDSALATIRFNQTLTHLVFGRKFNHPVDHYLPDSITHINFGDSFNNSVDYLPPSLITLSFEYDFDKCIDNLPHTLLYLKLGHSFRRHIKNLPISLLNLEFPFLYERSLRCLDDLTKLTHLTLGKVFDSHTNYVSDSVTHLIFGRSFRDSIDIHIFKMRRLQSVNGGRYNQTIERLPKNLIYLDFGARNRFNSRIDMYPEKLTHLIFGNEFNQSVNNLPNSLILLIFGRRFNQPINILPSSLKYLIIGTDFRQKLPTFPKSLRYFHIRDIHDCLSVNLINDLTILEQYFYN